MKYIKLFENSNYKIWKVSLKDKYKYIASLYKIGMSEWNIERWTDKFNHTEYGDSILIHRNESIWGGTSEWLWSSVNSSDMSGVKYTDYPEYLGEVEVTPEEIEICKLKDSVKKYNL